MSFQRLESMKGSVCNITALLTVSEVEHVGARKRPVQRKTRSFGYGSTIALNCLLPTRRASIFSFNYLRSRNQVPSLTSAHRLVFTAWSSGESASCAASWIRVHHKHNLTLFGWYNVLALGPAFLLLSLEYSRLLRACPLPGSHS